MTERSLAGLDQFASGVRDAFSIRGLTIGVTNRQQTLFALGLGRKGGDRDGAVDIDTVFGFASNTKAMTAATVELLVDELGISLDDPVRRHVADFALASERASNAVRIRDLLCHSSGLGEHAGDLLFIPPSTIPRSEIVKRVRHIPLVSEPGAAFAYNNCGYVVAGEIAAQLADASWDDLLQSRLFRPLGMHHSSTRHHVLLTEKNLAFPHIRAASGEDRRIEPVNIDNFAAAAGGNASTSDLLRWLRLLLGNGMSGSTRVLSKRAVADMCSPKIRVAISQPSPVSTLLRPEAAAYGLGFKIHRYGQHDVIFHGGNTYGYCSIITIVPSLDRAFVLLANSDDAADGLKAIHYWLLSRLLGVPGADWLKVFETIRSERQSSEVAALPRHDLPEPDRSKTYTGTYIDGWFGRMVVVEGAEGLRLFVPDRTGMDALLHPLETDRFEVRWRDPFIDAAEAIFSEDMTGRITTMRMAALSATADPSFDYADLRFERLPD